MVLEQTLYPSLSSIFDSFYEFHWIYKAKEWQFKTFLAKYEKFCLDAFTVSLYNRGLEPSLHYLILSIPILPNCDTKHFFCIFDSWWDQFLKLNLSFPHYSLFLSDIIHSTQFYTYTIFFNGFTLKYL